MKLGLSENIWETPFSFFLFGKIIFLLFSLSFILTCGSLMMLGFFFIISRRAGYFKSLLFVFIQKNTFWIKYKTHKVILQYYPVHTHFLTKKGILRNHLIICFKISDWRILNYCFQKRKISSDLLILSL